MIDNGGLKMVDYDPEVNLYKNISYENTKLLFLRKLRKKDQAQSGLFILLRSRPRSRSIKTEQFTFPLIYFSRSGSRSRSNIF